MKYSGTFRNILGTGKNTKKISDHQKEIINTIQYNKRYRMNE